MSKLSIIFCGGSFALLSGYQPVLDGVSKLGYEIQGIRLPTVGPSSGQGRDGPAPAMYEDAKVIAQEAERLADQGKDVILIGHSYSGVPITQSTKALSKTERKSQGKPGGIAQLAYMTCLVPALGQSALDVLSVLPGDLRPTLSIDEHGWAFGKLPAATAQRIMPSELLSDAEVMTRDFAKHSAISFGDKLTHAGYMDIPVSYLVCENDLAGPPELIQMPGIKMIEQVSSRTVDVTSIKSGHMPHLAAEKETVEWIVDVAKKVEEREKSS